MTACKNILFSLGFSILLLPLAAFSQGKEFADYKYRTLFETSTINSEATNDILKKSKLEEKHGFVGVDMFPSRARIQFVGTSRPISENHKGLMKTWAKLQRQDEKKLSVYENEFLFKECDAEYWFPVAKDLEKSLKKMFKSGDMVTAFVIHLGGIKEVNKNYFEWIFLPMAFER